MTITEAMSLRHTVRKYTDRPIPPDIVSALNEQVAHLNRTLGLSVGLVIDDESGIPGLVKLLLAKGVRNYFIISGPEGSDEVLGYASSVLMLFAQTLGLNTWWIGGMYDRKSILQKASGKPVGIVVVGYGAVQGHPHRSKRAESVSSYEGLAPEWFTNGVRAALLAPTAMNRQAFTIRGKGNTVSISYAAGPFSAVDLGIVKHHFETGAGKERFVWGRL
ncbi:MAG: nitroreductase [Clostridia bacterium]|nr:nitroreductase [Clostridia bacterium]